MYEAYHTEIFVIGRARVSIRVFIVPKLIRMEDSQTIFDPFAAFFGFAEEHFFEDRQNRSIAQRCDGIFGDLGHHLQVTHRQHAGTHETIDADFAMQMGGDKSATKHFAFRHQDIVSGLARAAGDSAPKTRQVIGQTVDHALNGQRKRIREANGSRAAWMEAMSSARWAMASWTAFGRRAGGAGYVAAVAAVAVWSPPSA